MTEETIFNKEADQPTTPEAPAVSTPPQTAPTIPQELQEFIGEGKKYKSLDDALKSVPHAQTHISTLEQEMATLKAELAKRKSAEELLEDIKRGMKDTGETTPKVDLSQEVVSNIVKAALLQEKTKDTQTQNVQNVRSSFEDAFGEKAEATYLKLAEDSGLSVQALNQLAQVSPSVVLKLAGLNTVQKSIAKTTGSVNTQAVPSTHKTTQDDSGMRVKQGATTKDVMAAWEIAKQKILSQQN